MRDKIKHPQLFPVTRYCIDSSAMIDLAKWYPRDIFPKIWDELGNMVKREVLISHLQVYAEIQKKDDELFKWCKKNKKMFKDVDECQKKAIKEIQGKYDPDYWNREISKTSPWADPWLIAISICEEKVIIVTNEGNKPNHIPYVASVFRVKCLNLLNFFRDIRIKYQ